MGTLTLNYAGSNTDRHTCLLEVSIPITPDTPVATPASADTSDRYWNLPARYVLPLLLSVLVGACSPEQGTDPAATPAADAVGTTETASPVGAEGNAIPSNPERNAYFGDLHVHTVNSFHAFLFGTRGGTLQHVAGFDMKLVAPLDCYAVTDHAFVLGTMAAMADPDNALSKHPDAQALVNTSTREDRANAFRTMVKFLQPENTRYQEVHDLPTVRSTWADLVEISQVKGTSETNPALSPNDEWADFEIMPYRVGTDIVGQVSGSYVREAWLGGLKMAESQGFDPFGFGVVAASDSHNASSGGYEDDYWGKIGMLDPEGAIRGSVPLSTSEDGDPVYSADTPLITFGAAGLAGVWAERNTRDAIYDPMRRRETFGTSGTRIKVRFFAGYDLPSIDSTVLIRDAYAGGVPMGAKLFAGAGQTPDFIVWASRAAHSAPLQRVQIIKGWITAGEVHEQVFDVACSDGLAVDPDTRRCPDNGAGVNLDDCSLDSATGAAELQARWRDPEFDASGRAFY